MRCVRLLRAALSIVVALFAIAHAADIRQAGRHGIVIEGDIVQGDHARLIALLDRNKGSIDTVSIYSNGGNVFEAIKMGALIRDLRLRTAAPQRYGPGGNFCTGIVNRKHCTCVSACVFVYAGGIHRSGNVLGVHRSYVTADYPAYDRMSGDADAGQQLAHTVNDHLRTMGFPPAIIDRLNATRSRDIAFLRDEEISRALSGYVRPFGEQLNAPCRNAGGMTAQTRAAERQCRQAAEQRMRHAVFARVIGDARRHAPHHIKAAQRQIPRTSASAQAMSGAERPAPAR